MRHLLSSILESFYLLAHTCKVEEYLCEICQRSYSTQTNWLDIKEKRHATTHYHRKQNVKSQRHRSRIWKRHHHHLLSTNTIPNFKTLLYKTGVVSEHIRVTDQSSHDTTQTDDVDIGGLEHGPYFHRSTTAFKINISYGFILRNRTSGRYKYYHSSCNCCGRYLDELA